MGALVVGTGYICVKAFLHLSYSTVVDSALVVPSGVRFCTQVAPELVYVRAVDGEVSPVAVC